MTPYQIEQGKKLLDQKNDFERVLEYWRKAYSGDDPITSVVDYLQRCNNLNCQVSKKEFATVFIAAAIECCEKNISHIDNEIEKL